MTYCLWEESDIAQEGDITTRPSTPSHDTTSGWGTSITCHRPSKRARLRGKPNINIEINVWHLQPQKGPASVKPPSLEIDSHQMWSTTVIPDLKEGVASQSQVQMSGRGARPLRRSKLKNKNTNKAKQCLHITAETFVVEDLNNTPSDCDTIENFEADSDSDYEMVDLADKEPSRVSEAMALEVSTELICSDSPLTTQL